MTTTEAALRDALEKIADECEGTAPDGNIVGIASKCHRIAKRALSQPSPASSTAGEDDYKRGIYAAKCWLRDQQHKNPPDSLWHAAAILADRMDVALLSPSSGEPASVAEKIGEGLAALVDRELLQPASVAVEVETLIAAGFDDYAAHCALKTESDGGFCHAYFYSDGQWRFQTGGHDLTIGKDTVRCVLTKRLYAHPPLSKPTPVEAGLREMQTRLRAVVLNDAGQTLAEAMMDGLETDSGDDFAGTLYQACDRLALAALSETQPPRETSTETKESGE